MLFEVLGTLVILLLEACTSFGAEESFRVKRGAAGYPVFGTGGGGHGGQNSYTSNDPSQFIMYLGGGRGGSSYGSSGGGQSYNSMGPLESNLANSYMRHTSSQPSWNRPSSPSSSGWDPTAAASSYSAPAYIPYFGLTSPNFANNGQSSAPATYRPAPEVHTLDATALLHTAQSSFNAQTAVFNALTAGSRPRPYKGGSAGY